MGRPLKYSHSLLVSHFTAKDIREKITHPDLQLKDDWVMTLRRNEARTDEDQFFRHDFKKSYLPSNSLFVNPQSFTCRADLVCTVVLSAQAYLYRCKNSKTRTERVRGNINSTIQVIEYLWLNDVVRLSAATELDFKNLPELFAVGGWPQALSIKERAEKIDSDFLRKVLAQNHGFRKSHEVIDSATFNEILGTNCFGLLKYLKDLEKGKSNRYTQEIAAVGTVTEKLTNINFLFDIGNEFGIRFVPFPKPQKIAEKFCRPPSRTDNLGSDVAIRLLNHAFDWIYKFGPSVAGVLEEVTHEVVECRNLKRKYMGRRLRQFFDNLENRNFLSEVCPFPIRYLDFGRKKGDEGKHSLRQAIQCIFTACFVAIAIMNGRRKDEIIHKKHGIRKGDLRLVNENFDLYEVDFYVEKTFKKRIPFYVNKVTVDAIKLLERLESSFHLIEQNVPSKNVRKTTEQERNLFSYRRFSLMKGVGTERIWYDFTTYAHDDDAKQFLDLALTTGEKIYPSTHMFRRAYALVFMYQYENAEIQALSYQLGHFSILETLTYVTDPASRKDTEKISSVINLRDPKEIYKAREEHFSTLEEEITEVGYEKLQKDIFAVMRGGQFAGGYARYIQRIQNHFIQTVKFVSGKKSLDDAIVSAVKQRGHFPKPMRHGQCMAGRTLSIKSAKCFSQEDHQIHQENAGASLCSNCAFHLTSEAYLQNIDRDCEELKKRMMNKSIGNFEKERLKIEISNIEVALHMSRKRMALKNS